MGFGILGRSASRQERHALRQELQFIAQPHFSYRFEAWLRYVILQLAKKYGTFILVVIGALTAYVGSMALQRPLQSKDQFQPWQRSQGSLGS